MGHVWSSPVLCKPWKYVLENAEYHVLRTILAKTKHTVGQIQKRLIYTDESQFFLRHHDERIWACRLKGALSLDPILSIQLFKVKMTQLVPD